MKKLKPPGKSHAAKIHHKVNINHDPMDKVKIKRVKRNKRKISTKEKLLAGLGLGSTLLGGVAGGIQAKSASTKIVSTEEQAKDETGKTPGQKVKDIINQVFGVPEAHAMASQYQGEPLTDMQIQQMQYDQRGQDMMFSGGSSIGSPGSIDTSVNDPTSNISPILGTPGNPGGSALGPSSAGTYSVVGDGGTGSVDPSTTVSGASAGSTDLTSTDLTTDDSSNPIDSGISVNDSSVADATVNNSQDQSNIRVSDQTVVDSTTSNVTRGRDRTVDRGQAFGSSAATDGAHGPAAAAPINIANEFGDTGRGVAHGSTAVAEMQFEPRGFTTANNSEVIAPIAPVTTPKEGDTNSSGQVWHINAAGQGSWTTPSVFFGPNDSNVGVTQMGLTDTGTKDSAGNIIYSITINGVPYTGTLEQLSGQIQVYNTRYESDQSIFQSAAEAISAQRIKNTPASPAAYTGEGVMQGQAQIPGYAEWMKVFHPDFDISQEGSNLSGDYVAKMAQYGIEYDNYRAQMNADYGWMTNYNSYLAAGQTYTAPKPAGFDNRHNTDGSARLSTTVSTTPANPGNIVVGSSTPSVSYSGGSTPKVGDPWTITVTGTPGDPVYATNNGVTNFMGYIGSHGALNLSGTFTAADLAQGTNWNENWVVGSGTAAKSAGNVNFTLQGFAIAGNTATTTSGSFTTTTKDNGNGTFTIEVKDSSGKVVATITANSLADLGTQMQQYNTANAGNQNILKAFATAFDVIGKANAPAASTGSRYNLSGNSSNTNWSSAHEQYLISLGFDLSKPIDPLNTELVKKINQAGVDFQNMWMQQNSDYEYMQAYNNWQGANAQQTALGLAPLPEPTKPAGFDARHPNGSTTFNFSPATLATMPGGVVSLGSGSGVAPGGNTNTPPPNIVGNSAITFTTSGDKTNPKVGDTWQIVINGKEGDTVTAFVPGIGSQSYTIPKGGVLNLQGTFTTNDLTPDGKPGVWNETWTINGKQVGQINFTVNPIGSNSILVPGFIPESSLTVTMPNGQTQVLNNRYYADRATAEALATRYGGTAKLVSSDAGSYKGVGVSSAASQWYVIQFADGTQLNAGDLASYFQRNDAVTADTYVRNAIAAAQYYKNPAAAEGTYRQQGSAASYVGMPASAPASTFSNINNTPPPANTSTGTVVSGPILGSVQTTLKFVNLTSGNSSSLNKGDRWQITITGYAGSHIYATSVKNGVVREGQDFGILTPVKAGDTTGTLTINGTIGDTDLGENGTTATWDETWKIITPTGTTNEIGHLNFTVLGARPASTVNNTAPTFSFTNLTTGNTDILMVGDQVRIIITGPKGMHVYGNSAKNGVNQGVNDFGVLTSTDLSSTMGTLEIDKTISTAELGDGGTAAIWNEGWSVGVSPSTATIIGGLHFTVAPKISGLSSVTGARGPRSENFSPRDSATVNTVGQQTYTVQSGDTLWGIAKKYYGDGRLWRNILEANTDKIKSPSMLPVGITLTIPAIQK